MRRLPVFIVLAALGLAIAGGYAVAQDAPATPEVVHPATPEVVPEFCATPAGIATPVQMDPATPGPGQATPVLFPCATPEGSDAAVAGLDMSEVVDSA